LVSDNFLKENKINVVVFANGDDFLPYFPKIENNTNNNNITVNIVLSNYSYYVKVNEICRKNKILFLLADIYGCFIRIFCDFGDKHEFYTNLVERFI
jgi:hypothetical protein